MRRIFETRRRRRLVVVGAAWALVLLAAPALLTGPAEGSGAFPPTWATHKDTQLARVVDLVARRGGSTVWCWSVADWEGRKDPWTGRPDRWTGPWGAYTYDALLTVHLSPNDCAVLEILRSTSTPVWNLEPPETYAWSTFVLAHESVHVAGYRSEKKAECWGLQRVATTAAYLGRSPKEQRYLARLAWRHWYRRARSDYRSLGCRDGGSLDLSPKSHVWP